MPKSLQLLFLVLLAGIVLLAAWLRLDHLDDLPPGISWDESTNAIDTYILAKTGKLPLYEYMGRPEHLHRIILAVGMRLFGAKVWAIRYSAVLMGLLTVAAAAWATRQALDDQPPAVRILGALTAAGVLAGSMSHLVLSRSIYRAEPLPLCVLLFLGWALRGLRTGRRRDLILAGISLGLAMHTYTAAYVTPVVFPAFVASLLIRQPRQWRIWLPRLIWIGVLFALVITPIMGMLIIDHNRILTRTEAVGGDDSSADLQNRFERVWRQLIERGDINSQYNADFAPVIPSRFTLVFYLGLLALILRIRHLASLALLALFGVSMIPVALANEIPHGLRIAGEHAVYPVVIGIGIASIPAVVHQLNRERTSWLRVGSVVVVGLFAGITIILQARATHADYIAWWDNNEHPWRIAGEELQHGEWFFRSDHRDLGNWLSAQDAPMLFPVVDLREPTVRAWTLTAFPNVTAAASTGCITSAVNAACENPFVLPPDTKLVIPRTLGLGDLRRDAQQFALLHDDTITIFPPLTGSAQATLLAEIDNGEVVRRDNGNLLLHTQLLPIDLTLDVIPPTTVTTDPPVTFAHGVRIKDWRGPQILSGTEAETITVTLDWDSSGAVNHFFTAFLQLQTQNYDVIAGDEGELWRWLYPPPLWNAPIPTSYMLDIPAGLAPGAYRLATGLYLGPFLHLRQPVEHAVFGTVDDMATVGWIKIPQPEPEPLGENAVAIDAQIADSFALTGYEITREDETLFITLEWETLVPAPLIDATVFVHALDANGTMVGQSDIRPANGTYPTFIWSAGERVHTEHIIPVGDIATDDLQLIAGMYTFPGPTRLAAVQNSQPAPDNLIVLKR